MAMMMKTQKSKMRKRSKDAESSRFPIGLLGQISRGATFLDGKAA
jgi:hypothetical protein